MTVGFGMLCSFRMFSNEDVTIGSWMLALNVQHEDDRSLCDPECHPNSVAVWDIPACSGRQEGFGYKLNQKNSDT